jgi:hypothetical protein
LHELGKGITKVFRFTKGVLNMDLKDFIKASLVEINIAISESNKELAETGAIINPKGVQINSENSQAYGRQKYKLRCSSI